MVTHIFLSSNLALPPVLCRLVIFNGPSPSDRLDDYKIKRTTCVLHGCSLTPNSIFWDDSGTVSPNNLEVGDFYHAN